MAYSNYSDNKLSASAPKSDAAVLDTPEHHVALSGARRYDPGTGKMSMLIEQSSGDWSYQPDRYYPRDRGVCYIGQVQPESLARRLELELQMPTYRASKHPYYDGPADGAPGVDEFQQQARIAHRDAGDYRRHPADMRL